ncbi:MAG: PQQ-dependent sugar dehydrogenase [Aestuariibacter sp.]
MKKRLLGLLFISCTATAELPLDKLSMPDGFSVSLYAENVKNARQMAYGDKGTIFVGSRSAGLVHALVDTDKDGQADKKYVLAENLNMPSGITFKDGSLYVATVDKVWRYDDIENNLATPPKPILVIDDLPSDKHHGWKYIDFGPDEHLYVPVGTPCNVCITKGGDKFDDPRYDAILKYDLSTGERQWVARGVRNSVGFDWHPKTKELWFSDNGRDWMGDDLPPCEINRVAEPGEHFGYPYVHGGDILDPDFGNGKNPADYTAPVQRLGAHVAPLGIHFYTGQQFPANYRNALFVAEHGSWNRSKKVGYRVMVAITTETGVTSYEPFIEGWLQAEEQVWGRPVALLPMPDGSLLISDDFADAIYRVTYQQ